MGVSTKCRPLPRWFRGALPVAPPPLSFWYPLFLVLNGMTFEGEMRKLSDKYHIKLVDITVRPCQTIWDDISAWFSSNKDPWVDYAVSYGTILKLKFDTMLAMLGTKTINLDNSFSLLRWSYIKVKLTRDIYTMKNLHKSNSWVVRPVPDRPRGQAEHHHLHLLDLLRQELRYPQQQL